MSIRLLTTLFVCSLALVGCEFTPASGPQSTAIQHDASVTLNKEYQSKTPYVMLNITEDLIRRLNARHKSLDPNINWPQNTSPKSITVNVGDEIQVTIYEAQSGGLFVPREAGVRPGNFISLPAQTIDASGYITVPYVGLVKAAGKTPNSIAKTISAGLADRAIEPQVVVSFANRGGSEVTVIGEVQNPSRFSLNFNDERVLDAIANAGGASFPGYETWVTLHRQGKEYTIKLDDLLLNPSQNIFLQSDDTLYIYREPDTFTIYGAAEFQGLFSFERREIDLADSIARAQGLNTFEADPSEIYVYRRERPEILAMLGDLLPETLPANLKSLDSIAVIYRLNLRKGDGFFLAQKFPMSHEDTVYVANSTSVELTKFLDILNLGSTTTRNTKDAF